MNNASLPASPSMNRVGNSAVDYNGIGLTKREYMAATLMSGILARALGVSTQKDWDATVKIFAAEAVTAADALLLALGAP